MDRQIVVLTVRDTVCTCSEAFARGSVVSLLRRSRYEVARVAHEVYRLPGQATPGFLKSVFTTMERLHANMDASFAAALV